MKVKVKVKVKVSGLGDLPGHLQVIETWLRSDLGYLCYQVLVWALV